MNDVLEQVVGYLRGLWRYRWYIHLIAWPICIGGWLYVHQLPDEYESRAKVFVDTNSALRPLLRGLAVQSSANQGLDMMTRTLMSRENLEKVARMTDMDLSVNTPEEMDILITKLKSTIKFSSGRDNNLYNIAYKDSDPQLAKNTVQSLLTIFVESTLGDTRKDTDTARKFIDQQIKDYESRLVEAERRLKEFKQKNAGLMPGEGGNYFSQLKSAKAQLSEVELEFKQAQNLRDELKRQLTGEEPVFGIVQSSSSGIQTSMSSHPLDARIASLEARLDELLLKYTDKHPDVNATKDTIARLTKKKEEDLKKMQPDIPQAKQSTGLNQNPVYQQLKISLGQAEAQIASLKPRVNAYKKNVRRLESLVDTIPQIEADLKNLNRDYSINKKNYEALLARRESAKLSEQAESSADDVKFRIIDPPSIPFDPIGPNRPLLESVVFGMGLAAGLAFAFFMSMIKPLFYTPTSLQSATDLPVLGYVSRIWTTEERKRRNLEMISFGLVGVALLGLFGGILMIESMEINMLSKVKSLL